MAQSLLVVRLRNAVHYAKTFAPAQQTPAQRGCRISALHSLKQVEKRRFQCKRGFQTGITPTEATTHLRENETDSDTLVQDDPDQSDVVVCPPVKAFDKNVLASNDPIEDADAQAVFRTKSGNQGMLFGVFDGHGGYACGQVVSKRLFSYITASLLSEDDLALHHNAVKKEDTSSPHYKLVHATNDEVPFVQDLQRLYEDSYIQYMERLMEMKFESVEERLQYAFVSLDEDMSSEAMNTPPDASLNKMTASVALSGSVSAVAIVQGADLYIASTGDCVAVLGSLSENETWIATKLTNEHNSDNVQEVKRIAAQHPGEKRHNLIRGDRLMGILAPLRAFGDFRFKWPESVIKERFGDEMGPLAVPGGRHYKSPPYLTAKPEITYHKLHPRDRFLVIGTDGLWDMMTPMQVIRLVGEHMSGKVVLTPLILSETEENITLEEVAEMCKKRQAIMKLKPADSNAATHLIRCGLGGSAYGVDHSKLSQMLTLPQDLVRMFRDDISLAVVYFDSEYLRHV